jgi:hypothetical protein
VAGRWGGEQTSVL